MFLLILFKYLSSQILHSFKKTTIRDWKVGNMAITSLLYRKESSSMIIASHSIDIWSIESGEKQESFIGHATSILSLDITSDERFLISIAEEDRVACVWDLSDLTSSTSSSAPVMSKFLFPSILILILSLFFFLSHFVGLFFSLFLSMSFVLNSICSNFLFLAFNVDAVPLQLSISNTSSPLLLTSNGRVSLFNPIELPTKTSTKKKKGVSMDEMTGIQISTSEGQSIPILSAIWNNTNNGLLIARGNPVKPTFETIVRLILFYYYFLFIYYRIPRHTHLFFFLI